MISPLFEPSLWVGLVTLPCTSVLLISHHLGTWETPFRRQVVRAGIWAIAGTIAWNITGSGVAWGVAALGWMLSWALRSPLRDYYLVAHILIPAMAMNLLAGLGWSWTFITGLEISPLTRTLLLINLGIGVLSLPLGLITFLPIESYLLRKRWRRPRRSLPPQPRHHYPKVAFHVPSYAEPPEVVCATLDTLSRIRYPNFEVLLIDNNTTDPALWQPLQIHCDRLNQQLATGAIPSENRISNPFRFFHVEKLAGAKAGAMNFALDHTAPDAELIAVVDADYQVKPNFLERLVGFFDDPNLGFVQTPHDYRDWQNSAYLRACYWECMAFSRLQLAALSEWNASFVIGTMCIIRRHALEQAGGWATWCLTEDSESAVRIHALGYDSLFISESFGQGLIPDTFQDYKKQRLRWTMGPIQQLFRHWRLYLPNAWTTPSKLSFWQQVLEIVHSVRSLQPAIAILTSLPLWGALLASTIYHQEIVPLPPIIGGAIVLGVITTLLNGWLTFQLVNCPSVMDMLLSNLAFSSLSYTHLKGAFLPLFKGRSLRWQRTNKFKVLPNQFQTLESVKTEIGLALGMLLLGIGFLSQASFAPLDLWFGLGIGFLGLSLNYWAAPAMALLADFDLRHAPGASVHQSMVPEPMVPESMVNEPMVSEAVVQGPAIAEAHQARP